MRMAEIQNNDKNQMLVREKSNRSSPSLLVGKQYGVDTLEGTVGF